MRIIASSIFIAALTIYSFSLIAMETPIFKDSSTEDLKVTQKRYEQFLACKTQQERRAFVEEYLNTKGSNPQLLLPPLESFFEGAGHDALKSISPWLSAAMWHRNNAPRGRRVEIPFRSLGIDLKDEYFKSILLNISVTWKSEKSGKQRYQHTLSMHPHFMANKRTDQFIFNPLETLGESEENLAYKVVLLFNVLNHMGLAPASLSGPNLAINGLSPHGPHPIMSFVVAIEDPESTEDSDSTDDQEPIIRMESAGKISSREFAVLPKDFLGLSIDEGLKFFGEKTIAEMKNCVFQTRNDVSDVCTLLYEIPDEHFGEFGVKNRYKATFMKSTDTKVIIVIEAL